jgi:hypothetical protein
MIPPDGEFVLIHPVECLLADRKGRDEGSRAALPPSNPHPISPVARIPFHCTYPG